MSRDFTTSGLLESVKRRANLPINQSTYTAARVLAFADDELTDTVIPMVRAWRNDHFVTYTDVTTTSAVEYEIPDHAMNRGLYNVAILDDSGRPYSLVRVDFDREIEPGPWSWHNRFRDNGLAYYTRGDSLFLYPESQSGETLRMYYERLPNKLVETSSAGLVTGVDSGTGVVTCAAGVPSSITTSTPICAVKGTPGFTLRFENITPTNKAATTVTIATASAALVEVGDYITLDGDSPLLQIPVEAHAVLAQAVTVKLLEGMGDENLPTAREALERAKASYAASFPVRVEQAPKRIFSRNRLTDHMRH